MGVLAMMAPVVPVAPAAVVVTVVVIPMVVSVMVVGVVVGRVRPEQMTPANRGRRSDAARRRRDRGQENEAEPHAAWTSPLRKQERVARNLRRNALLQFSIM